MTDHGVVLRNGRYRRRMWFCSCILKPFDVDWTSSGQGEGSVRPDIVKLIDPREEICSVMCSDAFFALYFWDTPPMVVFVYWRPD